MPFNSIHEIYNQQLLLDKPYVDSCVEHIKEEIETNVVENVMYFTVNLSSLLEELTTIQKLRIKDQVIYLFRNMGIRVYAAGNTLESDIFNVAILPRNNKHEFMKAYV